MPADSLNSSFSISDLQAGIITPTLFTILVLVAIVTTLMATPVFELVYRRRRETSEDAEMESNLAVTVSPPSRGSATSLVTVGSRGQGQNQFAVNSSSRTEPAATRRH